MGKEKKRHYKHTNNDGSDYLPDIAKEASKISAAAFAMAKNNHKYKQEDVQRIATACDAYIQEQWEKGKPLTVAGFILASGLPTSTWYDAKNGDLDSITVLYQMEHDNTETYTDETTGEVLPLVRLSEICKNAYLLIQAQLETNCYTNKGNPAGSIFGLKAQFGWQDDAPPQRLTQVLQICDAEQAKKALEMLR